MSKTPYFTLTEDNLDTFDKSRLSFGEIGSKKMDTGSFQFIPIRYKNDQDQDALFSIELHEVRTEGGTREKNGVWYITIVFDPTNEKDKRIIDIIHDIEDRCVEAIFKVRAKLFTSPQTKYLAAAASLDSFRTMHGFRTILMDPSADNPDGYVFHMKLKDYTFTDPSGVSRRVKCKIHAPIRGRPEVEWSELKKKSFSFKPRIEIFRIFSGTEKSMQSSLTSVQILSPVVESQQGGGTLEAALIAKTIEQPSIEEEYLRSMAEARQRMADAMTSGGSQSQWNTGTQQSIDSEVQRSAATQDVSQPRLQARQAQGLPTRTSAARSQNNNRIPYDNDRVTKGVLRQSNLPPPVADDYPEGDDDYDYGEDGGN